MRFSRKTVEEVYKVRLVFSSDRQSTQLFTIGGHGSPLDQEQRAQGSVLKQKELPITGFIRCRHPSWLLPGNQVTTWGAQSILEDLIDEETGKSVTHS